MKSAYAPLILVILACSSSNATGPVASSEVGVYTLTSVRGAPLPTQSILRGSTTLGPAHTFHSTEYDGVGSAVSDSVFQSGSYTVGGTDAFGTAVTVHISSGTDNGQPIVLPPGGVDLKYRINGTTLTWLAGTQPFYVYTKVGS